MSDEVRLVSEATKSIYKTSVGTEIELVKINNSLLMTAKKMAELYGVKRPTITRHLLKLFIAKQLNKKRVSSILTHKAEDGKLYHTTYYNAEAIVAVGLSLKTPEAEYFQKWIGVKNSKELT